MHRQAWTGVCLVLFCMCLSFAACADAVGAAKGGRDRMRMKLSSKQLRLLKEEAAGELNMNPYQQQIVTAPI